MFRPVILKHRQRRIVPPFGWIPLALLRDGHWKALRSEAKILYCFLCVVSDRRGISYYGDARLAQETGIGPEALERARQELVERDLIAFDQSLPGSATVQVLSLPSACSDLDQHPANTAPAAAEPCPDSPSDAPSWTAEQRLQAVKNMVRQLSTGSRLADTKEVVNVERRK